MHTKRSSIALAILFLLLIGSLNTNAQSPDADGHRFEVGGQFSVLNNLIARDVSVTAVQCVTTPCPSILNISGSRKIQPGFGGRFGYNVTNNLAFEAELNFFPNSDSFSQPDSFKGGHRVEGVFGVKAGKRFRKIGIFGKARPGFLYATKGDLKPIPGIRCVAIFPPPAGCFETSSKNSFALDVGGVVELYPTKRTLIRFDVGDTIVRLAERNVSGILNPLAGLSPSRLVVVSVPAETTHNLQISTGIGFRF